MQKREALSEYKTLVKAMALIRYFAANTENHEAFKKAVKIRRNIQEIADQLEFDQEQFKQENTEIYLNLEFTD